VAACEFQFTPLISSVAREAGVTREALYKALSEKGDPRLSTLIGVMKALGLKLAAEPDTGLAGS
jgi:probable addiction module antidote protein